LGENNLGGVQKPFQKDHLQKQLACIGMLAWRNQMKVQGPSLVHNFSKKMKKNV
jgi:hypothetical protein